MMKRTASATLSTLLLAASLLAGCGVSPSNSSLNSGVKALSKSTFKYALGADISKDPGVKMDETYSTQALPEKVDLRSDCSPVGNQGGFGACTSFATIKGLQEYLMKKQGKFVAQAPAYLWYQAKRQTGAKGQDSGVPTEFAVKMLDAYGSVPESEFPYLDASQQEDEKARDEFLNRAPSSALTKEGKTNRLIHGYKIVTKMSAIRKSLSEGMPVVVAMRVYSSMGNVGSDGLLPMPTSEDKFQGGHAVLAVGYDNAKKVLIIRNSWGPNWGDGGYFYMPYDYVKHEGVRLAVVPTL